MCSDSDPMLESSIISHPCFLCLLTILSSMIHHTIPFSSSQNCCWSTNSSVTVILPEHLYPALETKLWRTFDHLSLLLPPSFNHSSIQLIDRFAVQCRFPFSEDRSHLYKTHCHDPFAKALWSSTGNNTLEGVKRNSVIAKTMRANNKHHVKFELLNYITHHVSKSAG